MRSVLVAGYHLPLPQQGIKLQYPVKAQPLLHSAIDDYINEMQQLGVWREMRRPPHSLDINIPVSFLRKASGGLRAISDFRPLNECLPQPPHFTLPSAATILPAIRGQWMTSIDVKHAFLHLRSPADWRRVVLHVPSRTGPRLMCPNSLEFGMCHTPFAFHCVMTEALALLPFAVAAYLDDILVWGSSPQECRARFDQVVAHLTQLGWQINIAKSMSTPTQAIQWIGLIFDSANEVTRLPRDKRSALLRDLAKYSNATSRRKAIPVRAIASWLGRINFAVAASLHLKLAQVILLKGAKDGGFNPHVNGWKSKANILLPAKALTELRLLLHRDHHRQWPPTSPPTLSLECDSSLWGFGAILRCTKTRRIIEKISEAWPAPIKQQNVAEASGIATAMRRFCRRAAGAHLRIITDNVQCLAALNGKGKTPKILRTLLEAIDHCPTRRLSFAWKEGKSLMSDLLSRGREWMLAQGDRRSLDVYTGVRSRLLDWRSLAAPAASRPRASLPLAIFVPFSILYKMPQSAKGLLLYPHKRKELPLKSLGWMKLPLQLTVKSLITGERLLMQAWQHQATRTPVHRKHQQNPPNQRPQLRNPRW